MQDPLTEGQSRPSLADAVNALMADPSVLQGAFEALKKSGIGTPSATPTPPPPDPPQEEEIPKKEMAEASAPLPTDTGELVRALSPMLSMLSSHPSQKSGESKGADRRAALLVALRPYLSESRREAVDYIVKISQVSDLIKKSNRP